MSIQTVNSPCFFGGIGRFTTTLFTFFATGAGAASACIRVRVRLDAGAVGRDTSFDTFSSSSLLSFDGFSRKLFLPDGFAGGTGVVSGVVTCVFFWEFFPRPFPFPSTCDGFDDDVVASAVP